MPAWLTSLLPAAVPSLIQGIGGFLGLKSQQKAYDKMQEYNSPKAQMTRLQEAGLSPWLMYSQGNVGNMSTARPAGDAGLSEVGGRGLGDYMAIRNFEANQRLMQLDAQSKTILNRIARTRQDTEEAKMNLETVKAHRGILELLADFPYGGNISHGNWSHKYSDVNESFRKKTNELKTALSEATIDRLRQSVEGIKWKNVVDRVKAKYAEDYGMVGGDWTQGLGLIKSLGSLGRSAFSKAGKRPVDLEEDQLIKQFRKIKTDDAKRKANRFIFENKYNR